ncbi:MAG: tetratricopeptide repeat protein [Spirochaetaceae bacterium]|jgi:tetratricopeptide (TPR) repeat protein|nr:tetratricopeptide repeat protein [Spirochaetaceae bacterium]
MYSLISVLAVIIVLVFGVILFMFIQGRISGGDMGKMKWEKNEGAALKEANKRLAQNPRDPEALAIMGDKYFREGAWDQAFKVYQLLLESPGSNSGIDEFEANKRFGLAAMKLGLIDDAYRSFFAARTQKPDDFECNFNLGALEFQKKNYDKAIQLLQVARRLDPEHPPTLRYLGHAFFKTKKYKDAMAFIRKAIDLAPDDKESIYTLGECYYDANQTEQALKIFTHLRPDPVLGPNASLTSGTINMDLRQYDQAIEDFEIGLKHENIKPDVLIDLKYHLATVYLKKNEIPKALACLKDIQIQNPTYKDVSILIGKYGELNANKNLQIFLMAPSADFVALCRKIVMGYYQRAKIKITNISVNKNEWADILAEVDTPKWSDVVMFRFIRTQGAIGELIVRDFHSHLKEVKAGKGLCITVGNFSEEARRYTEARLIDLIEKDRLLAMLNSVDIRPAGQTKAKK